MGRVVGFFAVVLLFSLLYSLQKMKGRALVFFTPSVDSQDLQEAKVKIEIQKEELLIFENAIC